MKRRKKNGGQHVYTTDQAKEKQSQQDKPMDGQSLPTQLLFLLSIVEEHNDDDDDDGAFESDLFRCGPIHGDGNQKKKKRT